MNVVLKAHPAASVSNATYEARMRALERKIRIVVPPGELRRAATIFRLEVDHPDPVGAQSINNTIIDTWMEVAKPPPILKTQLEAKQKRTELHLKETLELIERLEAAHKTPSAAASANDGEAGIAALLQQRDKYIELIGSLSNALAGIVTRDVIVSAPSLPDEASGSERLIAVVAAFVAASIASFAYVLMRHATRHATPETTENLARLAAAFRFRASARN
jgi:uncharacterized protein involved in exopolysaccharide biosynthesis